MILSLLAEGVNLPVSWFEITQPLYGQWRASVRADADPLVIVGTRVTLSDETNDWVGTVREVLPEGSINRLDIVGGADALDLPTVARFYSQGGRAESILTDLCADVGEQIDPIDGFSVGRWRSRGGSLRAELNLLARFTTGAWRITPGGTVSLSVASGETEPPGVLVDVAHGARIYGVDHVQPLAGLTVEGERVGLCVHTASVDQPQQVAVWKHLVPGNEYRPSVQGGVVKAYANGRVDVTLDTGEQLSDIPLWSGVGVVPTPVAGVRTLILDLGDDPRATVAMVGAFDGDVSRIDIGGDSDVGVALSDLPGRALRYGDTIMVPTGAAAIPAPMVIVGPPFPVAASKVRA